MSNGEQIRAGRGIADGLASLVRPPFRVLLVLTILIPLVADSFGSRGVQFDETDWSMALLLAVFQFYVQIAATLAAGRSEPDASADMWLKAAWRRRCFWRLVGATIVSGAALVGGLLLAGIGIFLVGAVLAFAQVAAVLERRGPFDSMARSVVISRGARVPVGIVFGVLVVVPFIGIGAASLSEVPQRLGLLWTALSVVTEVLALAGTIALTRIFVALGGDATPVVLKPPRADARSG